MIRREVEQFTRIVDIQEIILEELLISDLFTVIIRERKSLFKKACDSLFGCGVWV